MERFRIRIFSPPSGGLVQKRGRPFAWEDGIDNNLGTGR